MPLFRTSLALICALAALTASAETGREACAERDPLRRPFFGDLHVHSQFSLDASTQGTRNRPADAYRFARGERLGIQPFTSDGKPMRHIQLARPLDFAAVTDHAELLGEWNICNTPGLEGHDSWVCRVYRTWPRVAFFWMNYVASNGERHGFCGDDGSVCREAARGPWRETVDAAEAAYDRSDACEFTAFNAYEWTGGAGAGNNFHRNVIFRNDSVPELPISFIEGTELSQLYAQLRSECTDTERCDALVIPHNSNLGGGMMFQTVRSDGSPITAADARERSRFETLVEIMQHKGESECMTGVGTADELCGFEKLAQSNFRGRYSPRLAEPPTARQFVRHALQSGLEQDARIGVNPFKFGIIASTDTHLAAPGLVAESAEYPGHGGAGTPVGDALPVGLPDDIDFNPGGLAVLWAEENTREALFDAMRRREAYGTSGPRMTVRFFGGWDYASDLCEGGDFAAQGYARGAPMGADLPAQNAGSGGAPTFAVSALRDPGTPAAPGTALQRVQIVKGWLDGSELRERVVDVAGSADNGASVDPASCETSGPGHDGLCAVWRDPDFDPTQRAFYYARIVENPTCRWSQKLCNARGVRCDDPATIGEGLEACCSPDHRPVIQERAWTSPIWYRPPGVRAIAARGKTPDKFAGEEENSVGDGTRSANEASH
jgi:hypothetical protein